MSKPTQGRPVPVLNEGSSFSRMGKLRENTLAFIGEALDRVGDDAVAIRFFHKRLVIMRHPDAMHQILIKDVDHFSKQTKGYNIVRRIIGNGLVTSEGDFWKRQRRIAQPAFHRKKIRAFGATMVEDTEEMLAGWSKRIETGETFDLLPEMMAVTLRIVGKTLFSQDVSNEARRVGDAVTIGLEYVATATRSILTTPLWVPTPGNRRFLKARSELDDVVGKIITERRSLPEDTSDLLGMFMAIQDAETGERMNDKQLRDEAMTIFLAGHETTAMTLTWTFWLLGQHATIEEALRAELSEVLGDRLPTMEDLESLPLLDRLIKESMRLCPPVPIVARCARKAMVVGGFQIEANDYILLSTYHTHRMGAFWKDPLAFDPDRFLPERSADRPKLAYLPFSAGRRKCIGDFFAMMEAKLVLATMLQRVSLRVSPGQTVVPEANLTMRPKYGLKVSAQPVASAAA